MTTIAVGDMHGNIQALRHLLIELDRYRGTDTTVVFLGDYLDRGTDTSGLLDSLIQFSNDWPGQVVFLEGNHEQWFLDSIKDHFKHSWLQAMEGLETVHSYSTELEILFREALENHHVELLMGRKRLPYDKLWDIIPDAQKQLLKNLVPFYEDENGIYSHAGIPLNSPNLHLEHPDLFRWGTPDFPDNYTDEKLVIYGHFSRMTSFEDGKPVLRNMKNSICLDSSNAGFISAVILPERRIIHAGKTEVVDD